MPDSYPIYFLSSSKPLTKTFTEDYVIDYPRVSTFTSYEERISSLEDFYTHLAAHSEQGHCLLVTGKLLRPLNNEPRGSVADPDAPLPYLVIDIDGADIESADQLLSQIPEFQDVSYILQYSASYKYKPGFRAHLFFFLSEPKSPKFLQKALFGLNARYSQYIDKTTHDKNRLLYIAPPIYQPPLQDPCSERLFLIKKSKPALTLTHFFPVVTGRKTSGAEGAFTKYNLNGGDSWGYYTYNENPAWMYNFKGEPDIHVPTLLPELWEEIKPQAPDGQFINTTEKIRYFREISSSGTYVIFYNGDLQPYSDRSAFINHLRNFGVYLKKDSVIPLLKRTFDPSISSFFYSEKEKCFYYNEHEGAQFPKPEVIPMFCPPTIRELLHHVTGGRSNEFIQWLAYIVKHKDRTGTAWILRGVQGTGKGLTFTKIIKPLVGEKHTYELLGLNMEDKFNSMLENKLVVFIDEVDYQSTKYSQAIEKLKHYITEPTIGIRKMYSEERPVVNRVNFIFASNSPNPIFISESDRRFHVGNYQETPLHPTPDFIERLEEELPGFYYYLCSLEIDPQIVHKPALTEEKKQLIELNMPVPAHITKAIKAGDLAWFIDYVSAYTSFSPKEALRHQEYVKALIDILENYRKAIFRDIHLRPIFEYLAPDYFKRDMSTALFSRLLGKYGIQLKTMRSPIDHSQITRGIEVRWKFPPEPEREKILAWLKKVVAA
jgi:hypothetical protein